MTIEWAKKLRGLLEAARKVAVMGEKRGAAGSPPLVVLPPPRCQVGAFGAGGLSSTGSAAREPLRALAGEEASIASGPKLRGDRPMKGG